MWRNNLDVWLSCQFISGLHTLCGDLLWFFFYITCTGPVTWLPYLPYLEITWPLVLPVKWWLTIGMFVSKYQQNWSDFEEIMASKVGVLPLKGQVSENLSMLKVKGFYHIWAWWNSWSCDHIHLCTLSFPRPTLRLGIKFCFNRPSSFVSAEGWPSNFLSHK